MSRSKSIRYALSLVRISRSINCIYGTRWFELFVYDEFQCRIFVSRVYSSSIYSVFLDYHYTRYYSAKKKCANVWNKIEGRSISLIKFQIPVAFRWQAIKFHRCTCLFDVVIHIFVFFSRSRLSPFLSLIALIHSSFASCNSSYEDIACTLVDPFQNRTCSDSRDDY